MKLRNLLTFVILLVVLTLPGWAQQPQLRLSGFLDDYPTLEPVPDSSGAFLWQKPGLDKVYTSVAVMQAEIFLDPESKYKGLKPDQILALSNSFQEALSLTLSDYYSAPVQPDPNTAVIRPALTTGLIRAKRG